MINEPSEKLQRDHLIVDLGKLFKVRNRVGAGMSSVENVELHRHSIECREYIMSAIY